MRTMPDATKRLPVWMPHQAQKFEHRHPNTPTHLEPQHIAIQDVFPEIQAINSHHLLEISGCFDTRPVFATEDEKIAILQIPNQIVPQQIHEMKKNFHCEMGKWRARVYHCLQSIRFRAGILPEETKNRFAEIIAISYLIGVQVLLFRERLNEIVVMHDVAGTPISVESMDLLTKEHDDAVRLIAKFVSELEALTRFK